jgi:hypothetical protein
VRLRGLFWEIKMVSTTFQVIFKDFSIDIKTILSSLKEAIEENYLEIDDSRLQGILETNYTKQINEDEIIMGFGLNFEDGFDNVEEIIQSFSEKINLLDDCISLVKFNDDTLKFNHMKIYERLFNIEMKLREIFSFIFIETYGQDYYNLIREINVTTQKDLPKKEYERIKHLKNRFENEFFYLLFSDYKELHKLKEMKHDDLVEIINLSRDFKKFKENILLRGIKKEYLPFIEESEGILSKLEKIRNCIAHNRELSNSMDCELIFEDIENRIKEFEISIKTPLSAKLTIKKILDNSYDWKVLLEYEKVPKERRDLGKITIVGGPAYETQEFEEEIKDSLLNSLEDLDYNIEELDKEMIDVEFS